MKFGWYAFERGKMLCAPILVSLLHIKFNHYEWFVIFYLSLVIMNNEIDQLNNLLV